MGEAATARAPEFTGMTAGERHWLLRRLHSISGIIPIGGFLLFHLFENGYVVRGAAAWWSETAFTRGLPFEIVIEAVILWIPILYHMIYGLVIIATSAPNNAGYAYERNLQYTLQRVTGILALIFILFHFFTTRGWFYMTGRETNYAVMHAYMMDPVIFAIYIIGTLACVYHLTNGIFTFTITWGLVGGPRSQSLVNRLCNALFVVLAIVSVVILISFRAPV